MKKVLALIIVMTTMIVVGLCLLTYGLVTQLNGGKTVREAPALALPADATVRHMTGDGDALAVYISADGGDKIYFVSRKKGLHTVMPVTFGQEEK